MTELNLGDILMSTDLKVPVTNQSENPKIFKNVTHNCTFLSQFQ